MGVLRNPRETLTSAICPDCGWVYPAVVAVKNRSQAVSNAARSHADAKGHSPIVTRKTTYRPGQRRVKTVVANA